DVADNNGGTATASAATYIGTQADDWNTAASGSWGTAANWSNGVPTSSVDALINATGGNYTVSLVSAAVAHSLIINSSNATLAAGSDDSLTITGALTVDAGSISLTGGTIQTGSIDLESGATMVAFTQHVSYVSGDITGTGSIAVQYHTTLELRSTVATTLTLSFTGGVGAEGTLVLDHSLTQPFNAVISGLTDKDDIDLKDLIFTSSDDITAATSYASGHTTLVVSKASTD